MARSRLPRLSWAPLRPRQAGWFAVIGLWVAMVFLIAAGVGLILTSGHNSGASRVVAIVIGSLLALLGVACLDPLLTGDNRRLRPVVDAEGIRLGTGAFPDEVSLSWDEVLGVGCNQVWSQRRGPQVSVFRSLEIFTCVEVDCEPTVAQWRDHPAPRAGLPAHRLTCTALDMACLERVAAAVEQYRPELWLGELNESWAGADDNDAEGELGG